MKRALIVVAILALAWLAWRGEPAISEAEVAAKLATADLRPYDPAQYPKLYQTLGAAKINGDVQIARAGAARAAAQMRECDQVMTADYSDMDQHLPDVTAFADCRNGFRIWFRAGKIVKTVRDTGLNW